MRNLSQYEEEEREKIAKELKTWRSDCDLLCEIEREIAAEFEESRKDHFREIEIETKAHRMAVETLGYWDFDKVQCLLPMYLAVIIVFTDLKLFFVRLLRMY